jgi:hypothetical protein
MKHWVMVFFVLIGVSVWPIEEEVVIQVPSEMTVEMILADEHGLINGTRHVRARIFDPHTLERVWFEDYQNQPIKNGAFVLTMNSIPSLNAYMLHKNDLKFVVSVEDQSVEIPLLTEFFSYRSLFAEFGWETRFPSILYIDRINNFVGIGMGTDRQVKGHVDIRGALKLGYEDTNVTGAIRWSDNSMWVKHPSGWVDLLYGPTTFEKSRWTDFPDHIELTSANYRVGIGIAFPQEKLHVNGTAVFSGGLKSTSLQSHSMQVNSFVFNPSVMHLSSLILKDEGKSIAWTQDNLMVSQIYGDGSGLRNVGHNKKDFAPEMIQSNHLDGAVISSRNIQSNAIKAEHLAPHTILVDRLKLGIFNEDTIGDNAITSDNFMTESLTFDMLITNNVQEYIPDGFFVAEKIASNAVFSESLKDQGIASFNIPPNIFTEDQFEDAVISGNDHITPNSIVYSKFKSGEIQPSLFSGVMGVQDGGTGIGALTPDRVIVSNMSSLNSMTNLVINSSNNLGIFETPLLTPVQKNVDYPLHIEGLDSPVSMAIRDASSNPIQVAMSHPSSTLHLTLNPEGTLSFDFNGHQLLMHPSKVISMNPSNAQEQLDLGSAITIGDATNSQPRKGTMEYEAANGRFRFYDGSNWAVISNLEYGIGVPVAKDHQLKISDAFVGGVAASSGHVQSSFFGDIDGSYLVGTNLTIGKVVGSHIQAESFYVDRVMHSTALSHALIGHQLDGSTVYLDRSEVSHLKGSYVRGQDVSASHLDGVKIQAQDAILRELHQVSGLIDHAALLSISDAQVTLHASQLNDAHALRVDGHHLLLQRVDDSQIQGAYHDVFASQMVHVSGTSNALHGVQDAQVMGEENMVFSANDVVVMGDGNRVFGSNTRVNGATNFIIGSDVSVQGDGNVVLNASDDPLELVGDSQVLLSAPHGVFIHTGDGMVVSATDGSGGWAMVSDKTLKTGFSVVDHQQVFDSLMALPITRWEYAFKAGVQHIGPMAQDFKSAFQVGEDDRFIATSDADGVAFSAIKHLIALTDQLSKKRSMVQSSDLAQLNEMITQLNHVVETLDQSITMKHDALTLMVDKNLAQYQMIDAQLKTLARYNNTPGMSALVMNSMGLILLALVSIVLGFYAVKRYDGNVR